MNGLYRVGYEGMKECWLGGPEGAMLPIICANAYYSDFMDFDYAVCESGLKAYVRPAMPGDISDMADMRNRLINHELIVVQELRPGLRTRQFLKITRHSKQGAPLYAI